MKTILALILLVFSSSFKFIEEPIVSIHWMTIEQAYTASLKNPKKTVIDVYTDWCGWCKVMDKKTFTNPEIIKYINENYYAVKLDAETRKSITLGSTTYDFNEENRANDIAIALLQGKLSYPSIVYLDEQFNMIQPIPGYMDAKAFHEVITFIGEDFHKNETFDAYKNNTYKNIYKSAIAAF
jgi:thioredoxin-related protein